MSVSEFWHNMTNRNKQPAGIQQPANTQQAQPQNTNAASGQNNGGGNGGGNHQPNNVDQPLNPWQDPENTNGGNQNQNANGNGNQNGNGGNNGASNQNDADRQNQIVGQYIDGRVQAVSFTPEQLEQIRNGDMTPVTEAMATTAKGLYRNLLADMTRMQSDTIKKAVDNALAEGKKFINTDKALSVMYSRLPATLDPNIRPVADSVFARYMQHHKGDVDKSVESVEKYFQQTAQKFGGGGGRNGSSRPMGGGNFDSGGRGSGNNQPDFDIDFVNILTGQDQPAA